MKLSTRVRYGVRAMVELAKQPAGEAVALRALAENQGISPKYLEQMVSALKVGGLLESVRGADGGYRLARPADQITVWDVYRVLDAAADPIDCLAAKCERKAFCSASRLWRSMAEAIEAILRRQTLQELADEEQVLEAQAKGEKSGRSGRANWTR